MFTLTIQTDGAAFEDPGRELARILRHLARELPILACPIVPGDVDGKLRDVNGNTCGRWELTPAVVIQGTEAECRHCGRAIFSHDGGWIDPNATGDDLVWRETCDAHDTFPAEHEPTS